VQVIRGWWAAMAFQDPLKRPQWTTAPWLPSLGKTGRKGQPAANQTTQRGAAASISRHGHCLEPVIAKGFVATNTVEGFFGIFKPGMKGVQQHCGEQHRQRYPIDFDFRTSNRAALDDDDSERATKVLKGIEGKRLTFRWTRQQPKEAASLTARRVHEQAIRRRRGRLVLVDERPAPNFGILGVFGQTLKCDSPECGKVIIV